MPSEAGGGVADDRHRRVPAPGPDGCRHQSRSESPAELARHRRLSAGWDSLLKPDRGPVHADSRDPDVSRCIGVDPVNPGGILAHLAADPGRGREGLVELTRAEDVEVHDRDREEAC